MNLQDLASKIISMLSPSKLANYIAELLEDLNSTKSKLKKAEEDIQKYKDEINQLKGENGKPKFKKKAPKCSNAIG